MPHRRTPVATRSLGGEPMINLIVRPSQSLVESPLGSSHPYWQVPLPAPSPRPLNLATFCIGEPIPCNPTLL